MKLKAVKRKIRCDVGGCLHNAAYALCSTRTGAHTAIYLCADCARALWESLNTAFPDVTGELASVRRKRVTARNAKEQSREAI